MSTPRALDDPEVTAMPDPTRPARTTAAPTPSGMRRAMGAFASGVTVVTGCDGAEPVGFACQSFASVSLEPPLVLFCAGRHGRAWSRIRHSGRFCVNVLCDWQTDLCDRFGSRHGAKFDGQPWEQSRWGSPALPDVLMRVHANVHEVYAAGDHDVVVGRVLELDAPVDARPLVFYRGRFGLEPESELIMSDAWGWGEDWS